MAQCELKPNPTVLTGPTKSLSSDCPTRWAIVAIKADGSLEVLSETRESKEAATGEALRCGSWWQLVSIGICPVHIDIHALEVVHDHLKKPLPLEIAAQAGAREG